MSSKTLGAACLVAGTTIGAGMLALPLTVSALGLIWGVVAMVGIWFVMYLAGLYGLELNLRAGKGMTLGKLGQFFSGPAAGILGDASLVILTYALMAAYLFGGASILGTFLNRYSFTAVLDYLTPLGMFVVTIVLILMGNLHRVDYQNRILFLGMLGAISALILGLSGGLDSIAIVFDEQHFSAWQTAIPVIFTSFGYHIIQNTMVAYCDYNPVALRNAFFWGSLIPLVAYVSWVVVVISIVYIKAPEFYQTLLTQKAELGQLMQVLSQVANCTWLQPVSWIVGLSAILTSAIGVGLAIISFWEQHLPSKIAKRPLVLGLVLIPPLLVGLLTPGIFIRALGFAGLILTMIAIFLPVYLLGISDKNPANKVFYPFTSYKILRALVVLIGVFVIVCEVCNIMK